MPLRVSNTERPREDSPSPGRWSGALALLRSPNASGRLILRILVHLETAHGRIDGGQHLVPVLGEQVP